VLTPRVVQCGLRTLRLGQRVHCYELVDSTNTIARELADTGAVDGTLVVAEEQSAGRGRLGRAWLAPRSSSLLLSLIFRPPHPLEHASYLLMISAMGVRQGIACATGLTVDLKWPNDLVYRGRKLGGILTEASFVGDKLAYAVVGIGLNVNFAAGALPAQFVATSLSQVLGKAVERAALLRHILECTEEHYDAALAGVSPQPEWAAALETLGRAVQVQGHGRVLSGLAVEVSEDGALLVQPPDGPVEVVREGDASLHDAAREC